MFNVSKDNNTKEEELKEIDEKKSQSSKEEELKKIDEEKEYLEKKLKNPQSSKEEELKKIREKQEKLRKVLKTSEKGEEKIVDTGAWEKKTQERIEKEGMSKIRGILCCLAFLFLWVVMMLLVRIGAGEGFFIICLPTILFLMIPFEYLFNKITW